MQIGHDVSHFHKYLREAIEREKNKKEETIVVPLEIYQVGRVEEQSVQDEE